MLYRGVFKEMHEANLGELIPHGKERLMSTYLHPDTQIRADSMFDISEANAGSAHESGVLDTCLVSTSTSWEVAKRFATHACGFLCDGVIYHIDDDLFSKLGITIVEPTERRYPEDFEVMIRASDGGNIPIEAIIKVEAVSPE